MSKIGLIPRLIKSIRMADSQADKKNILAEYKQEDQLKKILVVLYNPWIDLRMQNFKPKYMGKGFGMGMSRFMPLIADIISGNFDQREAEFACKMAMNHINSDDAEIFLGILHQDLGLGLEVETINQVWPGLIADYPLRLATAGKIDNFKDFPAAVQVLSQGFRINVIVNDGKVSFRDKAGGVIEHWDMYKAQFLNLAQGQNTVFDGHAVVANGNEIVETDNNTVLDAPVEDIRFMLWDVVRYDGFIQGEDTRIGYNWRYNGIEHMMMLAIEKNPQPCYDIVRAEMVGSQEQLIATVEKFGGQCVIKTMSSIWHQGPTTEEIIIQG